MAIVEAGHNANAHLGESLPNYQVELDTSEENYADSYGSTCVRCGDPFQLNEKVVQTKDSSYHVKCFVCVQCFQPFPEGVYYEFDGRKYCEHDFHVLFAPCCGKMFHNWQGDKGNEL
ncbi:LIM domain-containing protein unc-97 [Schistosoma haematobium]|uniref:LIM domain-containing protein unc-97 n=1 Tax=Schistosoma haematobium TaxID=6185 RepID=A0A922LYG5_SCHHA|nr:LIM domain-containing protein unc-97 [Schistosoma haematobium]KAH9595978.1 LIM domain-containing protein unc-97 [Schistosoma haematobium]